MIDEIGIPTTEIEADGFITRMETLERVSEKKAKPISECVYPRCEDCDKYHGHYCTVPMVVSKQVWLTTESLITRMENRLTELETLVTDEILRSKERRAHMLDDPASLRSVFGANFTWDDYLGEDK